MFAAGGALVSTQEKKIFWEYIELLLLNQLALE